MYIMFLSVPIDDNNERKISTSLTLFFLIESYRVFTIHLLDHKSKPRETKVSVSTIVIVICRIVIFFFKYVFIDVESTLILSRYYL